MKKICLNHPASGKAGVAPLFAIVHHCPGRLSRAVRSECEAHMLSKPVCWFAISLTALTLTGCGSGWSGVHKEAGPLPLSSQDKSIVRLVDKKRTFEWARKNG